MNNKKENEILIINNKITFYKDIIKKTLIYVQKNKTLDILGIVDINTCINKLIELNIKLNCIIEKIKFSLELNTNIINELQIINNELSTLLKNYGTQDLEDLLIICFGNNKLTNTDLELLKFELLKKYFHPISY